MSLSVPAAMSLIILVIGIIIAAIVLFVAYTQFDGSVDFSEEYDGDGNTRNIEHNPYVLWVPFIIGILFVSAMNLDRIETFIKKRVKREK